MQSPDEVLKFWLDEVTPKDWYVASDAVDQKIRDRFLETWRAAMSGSLSLWLTYPSGALAYTVLTDQFSRNMFRDEAHAFSSDRLALSVAKAAVDRKWDLRIDEPARQFFYLPMMHSENLCDQERAVRMFLTRMPQTGASNLLHAKAHRQVIREFGRFPYRNAALGRRGTTAEQRYLDKGGYRTTVQTLEHAA